MNFKNCQEIIIKKYHLLKNIADKNIYDEENLCELVNKYR